MRRVLLVVAAVLAVALAGVVNASDIKADLYAVFSSNPATQQLAADGIGQAVIDYVATTAPGVLTPAGASNLGGVMGTGTSTTCASGYHATGWSSSGALQCDPEPAIPALPLSGANGGLGVAQPTCSAGQHLTCNGTSCSCSADTTYTLPIATASALGGVKGTGTSTACSVGYHATGWNAAGTLQCAADPVVPTLPLSGSNGGLGAAQPTCTAGQHVTCTGTSCSCSADTVAFHASSHLPGGTDALATAAPTTIGTSNAEGSATSFARSDHVHSHGDLGGGSLHSAATTAVNGFMSSSDKTKLDRYPAAPTDQSVLVGSGTTSWVSKTLPVCDYTKKLRWSASTLSWECLADLVSSDFSVGTSTPLPAGDTPTAGTSTGLSREDHVHALTTPVAVRYYQSGALSLGSGAETVIPYNNKSYDTNAAVTNPTTSSWRFTVPTGHPGLYRFEAQVSINPAATGTAYLKLSSTAGTSLALGGRHYVSGITVLSLSTTLQMDVGDTARVVVYQYTGGAAQPLSDSTISNWIAITEIPGTNGIVASAPLVASVVPSSVSGSCMRIGSGTCIATTGASTCSGSGGSGGGYSFAWLYVSGDTATTNSASSASTTWTRTETATLAGAVYTGYYRCRVTDGAGGTAYSGNVTVTTTHTYDPG